MDDLTPAVPSRITHLAAAFSHPEPMRRGSLCERRMKCGQGACACQHDPKAAHGPYFLLTQKVEGKTRSRYVSPEQAPVVRRLPNWILKLWRRSHGGRRCVWPLGPWNNGSTRTPAIMWDRNYLAPAAVWPAITAVTGRPSKACWGLCI